MWYCRLFRGDVGVGWWEVGYGRTSGDGGGPLAHGAQLLELADLRCSQPIHGLLRGITSCAAILRLRG